MYLLTLDVNSTHHANFDCFLNNPCPVTRVRIFHIKMLSPNQYMC